MVWGMLVGGDKKFPFLLGLSYLSRLLFAPTVGTQSHWWNQSDIWNPNAREIAEGGTTTRNHNRTTALPYCEVASHRNQPQALTRESITTNSLVHPQVQACRDTRFVYQAVTGSGVRYAPRYACSVDHCKHMSVTSTRQAAEWGMRVLQGSFGRLHLPLPSNAALRARILIYPIYARAWWELIKSVLCLIHPTFQTLFLTSQLLH